MDTRVESATHMLQHDRVRMPGGVFMYPLQFFKFKEDQWYVFVTDNDDEYPHWSVAEINYRNFSKTLEMITPIPEGFKI